MCGLEKFGGFFYLYGKTVDVVLPSACDPIWIKGFRFFYSEVRNPKKNQGYETIGKTKFRILNKIPKPKSNKLDLKSSFLNTVNVCHETLQNLFIRSIIYGLET